MLSIAMCSLFRLAGAQDTGADITIESINPTCGIVAVEFEPAYLTSSTWKLHFGITTLPQKTLLSALAIIVAKMEGIASSQLSTRIDTLGSAITSAQTYLRSIDLHFLQKTAADDVVPATFPLLLGSLSHEENTVKHLCIAYKGQCMGNPSQGILAAADVSDLDQDVIIVEQILHEISAINPGVIHDNDIINWAITQLDTWKTDPKTCDMTISTYEAVFRHVLSFHRPLLGQTVRIPCLNERNFYTPYSIITIPWIINNHLWVIDLQGKNMVLFNKDQQTTELIKISDLKPLYPNHPTLRYYDGFGMARQPAASYIADVIPGSKTTEPEDCPLQLNVNSDYLQYVYLIAIQDNKWLAVNFLNTIAELSYKKGAQTFLSQIPTGNSILKLANKVLLTPNSKIFTVLQQWRGSAINLHYDSDNSTTITTYQKTDFATKSVVNGLYVLMQENYAAFLATIIITSLSFALMLFGFTYLFSPRLRTCVHIKRRSRHSRPRTNDYDLNNRSPNLIRALMPYLPRTNSSQW
jgi:hypothetical protein